MYMAYGKRTFPAKTKHLYNICTASVQRRRRWPKIAQMLFGYFGLNHCDTLNTHRGTIMYKCSQNIYDDTKYSFA